MRAQSLVVQGFQGTFRAKKQRKPGGQRTKLNWLFDCHPPLWVRIWVKRESGVEGTSAAEKAQKL